MNIGAYALSAPVALAPMAGITDKPFRAVCRQFGAGLTTCEMLSSDPSLRHTRKSLRRADWRDEAAPISVQIAGSDPAQMAAAARYNVEQGADIIDINMGCPVKKVCHVLAGSALLRDEALVADILQAVTAAVPVPVTLKTRLGWDEDTLNIGRIARLAEEAGIAALAIHGRTRNQMYRGQARYELIGAVKQQTSLPLWVNGDLNSPAKALAVQAQTGADGVMIGRAAQGAPWIFRDLVHLWRSGSLPAPLTVTETIAVILQHIQAMYDFYGAQAGVRIARKHIGWYTECLPEAAQFRHAINRLDDAAGQFAFLNEFLRRQPDQLAAWPQRYALPAVGIQAA